MTGDLNFTLRKGVSGLFRIHLVLRDDGRDELPPIGPPSLSNPITNLQSGRSEERILAIQVDAENRPPTFATDGKLEVVQAQVCSSRCFLPVKTSVCYWNLFSCCDVGGYYCLVTSADILGLNICFGNEYDQTNTDIPFPVSLDRDYLFFRLI
jgi:hypothetical protein